MAPPYQQEDPSQLGIIPQAQDPSLDFNNSVSQLYQSRANAQDPIIEERKAARDNVLKQILSQPDTPLGQKLVVGLLAALPALIAGRSKQGATSLAGLTFLKGTQQAEDSKNKQNQDVLKTLYPYAADEVTQAMKDKENYAQKAIDYEGKADLQKENIQSREDIAREGRQDRLAIAGMLGSDRKNQRMDAEFNKIDNEYRTTLKDYGIQSKITALNGIREILKTNNVITLQQLGTQLVKLSGDVGNIPQEQIEKALPPSLKGYAAKIKAYFGGKLGEALPEELRAGISAFIESMANPVEKSVLAVGDRLEKNLKTNASIAFGQDPEGTKAHLRNRVQQDLDLIRTPKPATATAPEEYRQKLIEAIKAKLGNNGSSQ